MAAPSRSERGGSTADVSSLEASLLGASTQGQLRTVRGLAGYRPEEGTRNLSQHRRAGLGFGRTSVPRWRCASRNPMFGATTQPGTLKVGFLEKTRARACRQFGPSSGRGTLGAGFPGDPLLPKSGPLPADLTMGLSHEGAAQGVDTPLHSQSRHAPPPRLQRHSGHGCWHHLRRPQKEKWDEQTEETEDVARPGPRLRRLAALAAVESLLARAPSLLRRALAAQMPTLRIAQSDTERCPQI